MARIHHRVIAGAIAGLFLFTSSALTIAVVWQASHQQNKPADDATAKAQAALKAQENKKVDNNPNKLQGQPLANYTPGTPITSLQGQDTTPGTGQTVKAGDTITVDYTGAVASTGVVFQSSKDTGQPVSLSLSQVIAGWSQGIPGMKVGGTRRLLIPAALAYGGNPPPNSGIPANADLVFDVTVHKIGQ